jgi:hypothetical protein
MMPRRREHAVTSIVASLRFNVLTGKRGSPTRIAPRPINAAFGTHEFWAAMGGVDYESKNSGAVRLNHGITCQV